jgi:hypothetical protein
MMLLVEPLQRQLEVDWCALPPGGLVLNVESRIEVTAISAIIVGLQDVAQRQCCAKWAVAGQWLLAPQEVAGHLILAAKDVRRALLISPNAIRVIEALRFEYLLY